MSEENTTPEATEAEVAAAAEQAAAVNVTVQDVANAYAIIDLAAKRGAFQAAELQAVGTVANKLKAFLDAVQAAQAARAAEEAPAEAAEAAGDEG